jgi:hypothetical protein
MRFNSLVYQLHGLATALIVDSKESSPLLRFTQRLIGDEPATYVAGS